MSKLLRGNFEMKSDLQAGKNLQDGDDLESKFEKAALARLGGSIGYVSRKKFLWNDEGTTGEKQMSTAGRAAQYDKE